MTASRTDSCPSAARPEFWNNAILPLHPPFLLVQGSVYLPYQLRLLLLQGAHQSLFLGSNLTSQRSPSLLDLLQSGLLALKTFLRSDDLLRQSGVQRVQLRALRADGFRACHEMLGALPVSGSDALGARQLVAGEAELLGVAVAVLWTGDDNETRGGGGGGRISLTGDDLPVVIVVTSTKLSALFFPRPRRRPPRRQTWSHRGWSLVPTGLYFSA